MKRIFIILAIFAILLVSVGCNATQPPSQKEIVPYVQDGYWYLDGVNLGIKAEGVDGVDGKNISRPKRPTCCTKNWL